jgi:S1-C subfamily serine protease
MLNDAPVLESYASAFRVLDSLTLDDLNPVKVEPSWFPGSVPKTVASVTPKAPVKPAALVSTPNMLKDALEVVVLVKAGDHLGSGFFVGSEGLLLTNAHVVERASRVSIHTADAESFLTTVLSLSKDHDLALLRVSARPTASLRVGRSETVVVETDIFAIGSPKGLEGTVTKGIVSAVRKFESSTFLQIDAAINPGNSGGPLVTETREVIGINTMKRKGAEQLGLAIAIDDVKKIL